MPKVTTSVARKDYPDAGIKKGDTYYSWQFYSDRSPRRSKTYPRPSQLTGSEKKSTALAAYEALEDAVAAATTPEDVQSALEQAASAAQDAIDMYEESISNMEEAFPGGSPSIDQTQEELDSIQEFLDECESAASDVESLDANDYEVKPDAPSPEDGGRQWDHLTEAGQSEMLEAAREIANDISLSL
jgi:hypothetical protein